MYVAVNLVSFLTAKNGEDVSTIDKVTICNAMSSFLDHPVYMPWISSIVVEARVGGCHACLPVPLLVLDAQSINR